MPIPRNYEQWRHCITVECGIALTPTFLSERFGGGRDERSEETLRYRRLYGDRHWAVVQGWFERALKEVS